MKEKEELVTYIYENSCGIEEEIEFTFDCEPPPSIMMPTDSGHFETFVLIYEEYEDIDD